MPTGWCGNEPFGSRPEPGARLIAPILPLPHGEVPKGPAGAHLQSTCTCAPAHSKAGAGTGRYLTNQPTQQGIPLTESAV